MTFLAIRTDKPEAELYIYDGDKKLGETKWQAHRELSKTLHQKIKEVTGDKEVEGIVVFKGPGSFTGLRIGFSVANAMALARKIPIVSADGNEWLGNGAHKLLNGQNEVVALPEYGGPAHTTKPEQ